MFSINVDDFHFEFLSFAFFVAFVLSYLSYETIIEFAKQKKLMDEPDGRSSHKTKTPTLGGVAIYLSLLVVIMTIGTFLDNKFMLMTLACLSVLLFLGLKDDLLVLSPRKKFIIQLLTGVIFIAITDIRITSLFGVLGFVSLNYLHSFLFSLFVYVLIINAYNMIDGIDGLAGGFGVLSTTTFSVLFCFENEIDFAVIGLATSGSLIAFLRHNLSKNKKIFMGDTGTMIVGFVLAILVLGFLNVTDSNTESSFHKTAPAITIAILFYPLMDTLRVFILRTFKYKKSPFTADRNHIHHSFIDLKLSHLKISILLLFLNALLVLLSFIVCLQDFTNRVWLIIVIGSVIFYSSFRIVKFFKKKHT